jgi:amidohydrolase
MDKILRAAHDLFVYTRDLRRDFHKHPELGFEEKRTAGIVADTLIDLNLEVVTGVARTGVTGLLETGRPGPNILLRSDMDALPITEENDTPYASTNPGVMHACGHDGHTAIGLTVARLLTQHKDELCGTVKFAFQPAEEGWGGAERMVLEGVLRNPKIDLAMGVHLWNDKPIGWMGIPQGPIMGASDVFTVKIKGKGGHGAVPDRVIDPILATGQIITALQTVISRNVSPLESAVISITGLQSGGKAFNIIPSEVEMRGTIRTFKPLVRELVIERFHQVIHGAANTVGCMAEINVRSITPAVTNHYEIAAQVQDVAVSLFGTEAVDKEYRTMGAEDISYIMREVPGCFMLIGSANATKGLDMPHHHPQFDFDEDVLPNAVALLTAATLRLSNCEW